MLFMGLFLLIFQAGISPQPWALATEIFPTRVRGVSNSITTFSNFASNYIISSVFLTATSTDIGKVVSYLAIAFVAIVAWIVIYNFVPETKGKTMDECVEIFMSEKGKEKFRMAQSELAAKSSKI